MKNCSEERFAAEGRGREAFVGVVGVENCVHL